jgi:hypothetical protein
LKHLQYFAIASRKDGAVIHFSGPHATRDAANAPLKAALTEQAEKGIETKSAGTFAADFEATPIPAPAVKANSKEAS